jgi:hypothetical protein
MANKPTRRAVAAPVVDPQTAKAIEQHVAASIRKSQAEWHDMVLAARKGPARPAAPAYQGHDH